MSIMQSAVSSGCGQEYPALLQQGSFMCPVCHKLTIVNARHKLRIQLEKEVGQKDHFALGAGETREKRPRHQRTQQPNTTDTIVNLSNKDSQQLKRRSSIRDCPLYRTRRRSNQRNHTQPRQTQNRYSQNSTQKSTSHPQKQARHTNNNTTETHTPSESERHQRGSRQNIKNATETQRQPNIQRQAMKSLSSMILSS